MGAAEQWQELTFLVFCSEINFLTGVGDLAFIAELRAREEKLAKAGLVENPAAATASEVLSVLWGLRVALVVATMYVVIAFEGVHLAAYITGGVAILLYGVQMIKLQETTDGKDVGPKSLIFAVGYFSVVNFILGLPYRVGPGPRYLWAIQILASIVSLGLILGYAFSVPEIRDSFGCYRPEPYYKLGELGVCPNSTIPGATHMSCRKIGRGNCDILRWSYTIGSSVLRVARTILSVGLGLYAAASERCYRRLSAL